jgi:4-hydroxybenzoate polyprenyltransferase
MNYLKLIRTNHWVKNLFILLPLFFEGKANLISIVNSFDVLLIFSLSSSLSYIFNDFIDFENDKKNPYKKMRPLTSGKVSINEVKFLFFIVTSLIILLNYLFFNPNVIFVIVIYLFLNLIYSTYFKKIFVINILFLLSFYYLRIFLGSLYFDIPLTQWVVLLTLSSSLILILGKKYKDYDINIKEKFTLNNKVNFLYLIVLVAVFQIVIYSVYSLSENAIFKYGNLFPYSVLLVIIGNVRYLYIIKYKKLSSDQVKVFFEDKLLIFILLIYFLLITYMLYF